MNATNDIEREHEALSELLPLAVGGALSADERARLDAHLARCDACRAELALLRGAQAQLAVSGPGVSPDAAAHSLDRVLSRVQAERARAAAPGAWQRWLRAWAEWPSPARWWVAGQAALAVVLALLLVPTWLAPRAGGPGFETAAGPTPPADGALRVRVAWRDDASAAKLRELLASLKASVVAGPSAAGFYTVQFGPGAPQDAVARLRARADLVQWVEAP